jgi:flagellar biosynthesis/type III secretory pathway chaperone
MTVTAHTEPDTMDQCHSEATCEENLASLLEELTDVQDQLLDVLAAKRQQMATGDVRGMTELQPREEELCRRLQRCHDWRGNLLSQAAEQGLPSGNLGDLATAVQEGGVGDLRRGVKQASARMRLLQHQSLANWVLAQKSLLHVSQMLQIIATGGRLQPTYDKEGPRAARGSLVDEEV